MHKINQLDQYLSTDLSPILSHSWQFSMGPSWSVEDQARAYRFGDRCRLTPVLYSVGETDSGETDSDKTIRYPEDCGFHANEYY